MACLGPVRFGHNVYDVEDVDAALGWQIFASNHGRADNDDFSAGRSMFGSFKRHGFDAHDYFGGVEFMPDQKGKNLSEEFC